MCTICYFCVHCVPPCIQTPDAKVDELVYLTYRRHRGTSRRSANIESKNAFLILFLAARNSTTMTMSSAWRPSRTLCNKNLTGTPGGKSTQTEQLARRMKIQNGSPSGNCILLGSRKMKSYHFQLILQKELIRD